MDQQDQEKDQLERRLAEQAVFRQVLAAKAERLGELEAEVTYLRRTLNDLLSAPRPQAQPVYAPARKGALPRRWQVAA